VASDWMEVYPHDMGVGDQWRSISRVSSVIPCLHSPELRMLQRSLSSVRILHYHSSDGHSSPLVTIDLCSWCNPTIAGSSDRSETRTLLLYRKNATTGSCISVGYSAQASDSPHAKVERGNLRSTGLVRPRLGLPHTILCK
jgi:hypothetical protein